MGKLRPREQDLSDVIRQLVAQPRSRDLRILLLSPSPGVQLTVPFAIRLIATESSQVTTVFTTIFTTVLFCFIVFFFTLEVQRPVLRAFFLYIISFNYLKNSVNWLLPFIRYLRLRLIICPG